MFLWTLFVITTSVIVVTKVYQKLTCGICKSSVHMVGKTVIVTGGNSGLGLETAKDLANRGARVILACRSVRKANAAIENIVKTTGNTDVHFRQLDLTSLRSVREFCDNILKTEKRLDVLINNAGAGGLGNYKTEDGLHVGMQVNYFGPFLLTCLLLPLMKSSAPSRIVNVSSMIHKYGELDFDNLNMEKYWSDYLVYANSKLFLNLMTLELSERYKGIVTANSLHPGISATNILRNIPNELIRKIAEKCIDSLFKSPWEASQTSIYLAVAAEVKDISGKYFSDCKETDSTAVSRNAKQVKRLWAESERLVNFCLTDS